MGAIALVTPNVISLEDVSQGTRFIQTQPYNSTLNIKVQVQEQYQLTTNAIPLIM